MTLVQYGNYADWKTVVNAIGAGIGHIFYDASEATNGYWTAWAVTSDNDLIISLSNQGALAALPADFPAAVAVMSPATFS